MSIELTATRHLQRTYSGLLDDTMLRYGSDYVGDAFFNKMIVKNLFFGGGIYLNDGYLVNHPTARKYLYEEDSLLRTMIRSNFIRLLTRTTSDDELINMPEKMAESGNQSFQELTSSTEWSDLKPVLTQVAQSAYFNNNVRSWPRFDMSDGFVKLIERTFPHAPVNLGLDMITEDEFRRIQDAFWESDPRQGNPRDKWEKAAIAVLQDSKNRAGFTPAMQGVMNLSNQAYHYNFGLTLTDEDDFGVTVDTTIGQSWDEFLQTREIERGVLDQVPLIQVPDDLPLDNGEFFLPFLYPDTEVGRAKLEFLDQLQTLVQGGESDAVDAKRDLLDAAEAYVARLESMFAAKIGKTASEEFFEHAIYFAVGQVAGLGPSADQTIATAAPNVGLALTLQSASMNQSRQFLMGKFRLKDSDFEKEPNSVVTVSDIRPQLTSLAFNPQAAADFTKGLKRFEG